MKLNVDLYYYFSSDELKFPIPNYKVYPKLLTLNRLKCFLFSTHSLNVFYVSGNYTKS